MQTSLYELTFQELVAWIQQQGEAVYRARQIFQAIYHRQLNQLDQIRQLPAPLLQALASHFSFRTLSNLKHRHSSDGTQKWLFDLPDKQSVETVLISVRPRNTVCISTQVGCAYKCVFCASGLAGFFRNLSPGEIVQQVLEVQRAIHPVQVTHLVFMGMGEPLSNYDSVMKAIRILNDPEGFHIGARKITLSTVGLVPKIEQLAKEGLQVELAVSLHAPNNLLRDRLMPVNKRYPLEQLIPACRSYAESTRRMITFEYILIDHVNDGLKEAVELAGLLKDLLCKVNLIPCHPVPGTNWKRPEMRRMLDFEKALRSRHVRCTLRRSRGLDIEGACGQLRLQQETAPNVTEESGLHEKRVFVAPQPDVDSQ